MDASHGRQPLQWALSILTQPPLQHCWLAPQTAQPAPQASRLVLGTQSLPRQQVPEPQTLHCIPQAALVLLGPQLPPMQHVAP
jgi:hypothetical protein